MPRIENVILDGGRSFALAYSDGDIIVNWINAPEGADRNIGRFGRDGESFYAVPLAMDQADFGDALLREIAERAGIALRAKKAAP